MQPLAPFWKRPEHEVVGAGVDLEARDLAADLEIGLERLLRAARVLDAGDVAVRGQRLRGLGLDVVLGARRDVVEVDRRRHRVGHRREVADQPVLGARG